MLVTRDAVKEILLKWHEGFMETKEVQAWASEKSKPQHTLADWEEGKSIIHEILGCLEGLALNIITSKDVPALLELLATPEGSFDEGIFNWENYLVSIDIEMRNEEVKADASFRRNV